MTKCKTCDRAATGTVYSMGVSKGDYCDIHGRYMLDSGQGDAAHDLEPDSEDDDSEPLPLVGPGPRWFSQS